MFVVVKIVKALLRPHGNNYNQLITTILQSNCLSSYETGRHVRTLKHFELKLKVMKKIIWITEVLACWQHLRMQPVLASSIDMS